MSTYISALIVGKKITLKAVPSGTGEPLKEIKDMLEDKNNKQVRKITGGPLKKKEMLRDENNKQVRTSMGELLKNKEMFRDEKGKRVRTYAGIVSTGKIGNERERRGF